MSSIGIVVLAAGASKRLGSPKQLLRIGEHTLLRHVVSIAQSVPSCEVLIVLGAYSELLRPEAEATGAAVIENPDWNEGMGSSVRAGLARLRARHPDLDAALFLVCDQPLISEELLTTLIHKYETTQYGIVAAEYGESVGVPALFGKTLFDEIAALRGAEGARHILTWHENEIVTVPFPEGLLDVDTLEDYQRYLAAAPPAA